MTNDYNTNVTLCAKIAELRRASGMTQDALAEKLGVTYQAVSKWENNISCPDIALIPVIADIFGVSIDALFGREIKTEAPEKKTQETAPSALPWEDDGKLYAVLFRGTTLLEKQEYKDEKMNITLELDSDVHDIRSEFNVSCYNVTGNVNAGSINCDTIHGTANAGSINCDTIGGNAQAGAVTCDTIEGDVIISNGRLTCNGEITGDVHAENCKITVDGDVTGNIEMKGENSTLSIEGDAAGDIRLANGTLTIEGDAGGDIRAEGNNTSISIEGDTGGDIDICGADCTISIEGDMGGNIDICGADCTISIEGDMGGDIDINAENATVNVEGDMD